MYVGRLLGAHKRVCCIFVGEHYFTSESVLIETLGLEYLAHIFLGKTFIAKWFTP